MKKAQFLDHWQDIEADQNIKISPVAYKHEGSTKESTDRHIQELLDSYNCYIAERLFGTKKPDYL